MQIKHISSYLKKEVDDCLDQINNYIKLYRIKKEDILKLDYELVKDSVEGSFWKIHLFYYYE